MTDATDHRSQWDAYGTLWTVADEADRLAACDGALAPNCTYTDPAVHADGWAEIVQYMTGFQADVPGGHFVTTAFTEHHNRSLARWQMALGDGTVVGTGHSFATYDDSGLLTSMTGFFDGAAAE